MALISIGSVPLGVSVSGPLGEFVGPPDVARHGERHVVMPGMVLQKLSLPPVLLACDRISACSIVVPICGTAMYIGSVADEVEKYTCSVFVLVVESC